MNHVFWIRGALVASMAIFPLSSCTADGARDNSPASNGSSTSPPPVNPPGSEENPSGSSSSSASSSSSSSSSSSGNPSSEFGAPPPATQDYELDTETATSKTTGLMWLRATLDTRSTGGSCANRCTELTAGGRDDWRAPTLEELKGLLVTRSTCPLIDEDAFPLTLCSWYTSSDMATESGNGYMMLSFYSGEAKSMNEVYKDTGFPCRCVR